MYFEAKNIYIVIVTPSLSFQFMPPDIQGSGSVASSSFPKHTASSQNSGLGWCVIYTLELWWHGMLELTKQRFNSTAIDTMKYPGRSSRKSRAKFLKPYTIRRRRSQVCHDMNSCPEVGHTASCKMKVRKHHKSSYLAKKVIPSATLGSSHLWKNANPLSIFWRIGEEEFLI